MSMNKDDILNIERVMASVKRGIHFIALSTLGFLSIAVLYVVCATPKYTAMTSILLDPTQAKTVSDISAKARPGFENEAIVSQVEIIKSRGVVEKALEYLLSKDEYSRLNQNFVQKEKEIGRLLGGLRVYREGESYILNIRYTATDPQMAADCANAFAQAYIYDQINSFSEGSAKTSIWLKNKIEQLREQSIEANTAIQKFRVKNHLINSSGRNVNEQQLSNINAKLGDARAEVASTFVRFKHSQEIVEKKDISAAVAEAFDNDVINNIRANYLDSQQRLLKLQRTLGPKHQAVIELQKELRESENVIFNEMKRIAQSYKNEYEIALARVQSLTNNLNELIDLKVQNDSQLFELQALEQEAESYTVLHDDYLKKFEKISQQESFPVAESRIISVAVPPLEKSHPKSLVIIGMALVLGAAIGFFFALLADNFDKSFKRAGQVESAAGLFFLGFFPRYTGAKTEENRQVLFFDPAFRQSTDDPLSLYAETCRNINSVIDKKSDDEKTQVIGIVSDLPNIGKSVTASNLALFIAAKKHKCLLIDADIRNPVLSKSNFSSVEKGLADALSYKKLPKETLLHDQKTGLFVLPMEQSLDVSAANLVNQKNMKPFIKSCRDVFDYIIIDMPPLSATSDASSLSPFIDCFLLALVWGKSKPNSLNFHLKQHGIPKSQVLGAVLSQTDIKKMVRNYDHAIYPEYTRI